MVLRHQVADLDAVVLFKLLEQGDGGRAGRDGDVLVVQILDGVDTGVLPHGGSDLNAEVVDAEAGFALTGLGVRRGAAFNVNRAVLDERNSVRARDGLILDRQVRHVEFLLHGLADGLADFEAVARGRAVSLQVGERNGSFAVAERHRAGVLDALERAGQFGGGGGGSEKHACAEQAGEREGKLHGGTPENLCLTRDRENSNGRRGVALLRSNQRAKTAKVNKLDR